MVRTDGPKLGETVNCETSTRTGCGDWSASIELPDSLDPPTMLGISIEVNDDDDLDASYVQGGESTHYYEFELHRASTEAGLTHGWPRRSQPHHGPISTTRPRRTGTRPVAGTTCGSLLAN